MSGDGHESVAGVLRHRTDVGADDVPGAAIAMKPYLLEMLIINFLVWAIIIFAVLR